MALLSPELESSLISEWKSFVDKRFLEPFHKNGIDKQVNVQHATVFGILDCRQIAMQDNWQMKKKNKKNE